MGRSTPPFVGSRSVWKAMVWSLENSIRTYIHTYVGTYIRTYEQTETRTLHKYIGIMMKWFKKPKMNFGAWPKMTKNRLRCEAEMRYQWTKMNLDAQCFEFEMVTKWPSMNCGAKLRCTKTEQEWSSVRNLAKSCEFNVVTKWPKMNIGAKLRCAQNDKNEPRAQCFVIDVVYKMTQIEHRCEVKCILLKQRLQSSKN